MAIPKASFKNFFKDSRGKTVIWQKLNPPIILWGISTVMSKLIKHGNWHNLFDLVAFGAIFTWAWLEITKGASLFRRVLGAIVLILSIRSRI